MAVVEITLPKNNLIPNFADFMGIFGEISPEIDRCCTDLTSVFNVFNRDTCKSFAILTTKHSRNEPVAELLRS